MMIRALFVLAALAFAAIGVGYTVQSHAGTSRSFSTGARSYSAPARVAPSAPAPRPNVTVNKTINQTTVVHQNSGGGSSGMGNALLGGVIGYELGKSSQPQAAQPAYVPVPQAAAVPAPQVQYVTAVPPPDTGHGFWYYVVWLLAFAAICCMVWIGINIIRDIRYDNDGWR